MSVFFTFDGILALLTLAALEVVLGVDNLVFISIISARLPVAQQALARKVGLSLALGTRLLLLFSISWMMGLTRPLFSVPFAGEVSGRDLILLAGGLFLIAKATWEIYDKVEVGEAPHIEGRGSHGFAAVIGQIMLLDVIFSLDSVITAVGMVNDLPIMVTAIVIAMGIMLFAMEPVNGFIEAHPSMKILALAFLLLIGVILVADGLGHHVPKGYIYFAMAFSLGVELLNIRSHRKRRHQAHS
jgi:predicted tellurium resistance membrane protein TerC